MLLAVRRKDFLQGTRMGSAAGAHLLILRSPKQPLVGQARYVSRNCIALPHAACRRLQRRHLRLCALAVRTPRSWYALALEQAAT